MLSESKGTGVGEISENAVELCRKLTVELEKLLPHPLTLPKRRLELLVESSVSSQIDSCLYHNSPGPVSLYEDHCCSRDEIPTVTVQVYIWDRQKSEPIEVLAGHSMTVNCVSWKPRNPQILASTSDDHTIRIWGSSKSISK